MLAGRLGLDPGEELRQLEVDVLNQEPQLLTATGWGQAVSAHQRAVAPGSRTGLRSTVDLLRTLSITGGDGLVAAREQRLAAILAAERAGDPELTARIIGGYDVPALWSRADDPGQARQVVDAAERTLASDVPETLRARLLATIAIETRGTGDPRGLEAAVEAERIARRLTDPALLVFALNGVFLQTFVRPGAAAQRDAIGAEIIEVSARHDLITYEILGHLIRMQSRSAFGDFTAADTHAEAAERLAERYESPLVTVFTTWYRAMRTAATGGRAVDAYRAAAVGLSEAGMPGLADGLLSMALVSAELQAGRPAPEDGDFGPYERWARPVVLVAEGHLDRARDLLRDVPDPPPDHLIEANWCLLGQAGVQVGDRDVVARARAALEAAKDRLAGAGSGVLTLGPATLWLDKLVAPHQTRRHQP
jgi:hypothetical protein